jgi:nitroreductase
MEFLDVIKKRISIRKYKDKPVEKEKINRLIDIMRLAPSSSNRQTWKFVAVTEENQLEKMRAACENRGPAMTAPLIFCICETEYEQLNDSGYNRGTIDASIATTYLHLATYDMGLSSCWVGSFDSDMATKALDCPDGTRVVTVMTVGYPDENPAPRDRLDFKDVAIYDKF